ncbi:MAG TPA: prenyltransferase/squalene oxidase repeat-containing protein [Thermoplasmata archaeon]|nr:prenyltransferase/squalene oxidase repeat-containing protein [Thermoplasmata archaeon]
MKIPPKLRRWLTGPSADPSVRVRFFQEIEGRSAKDPRVRAARREIGRIGWAASLLQLQWPDGHWVTPGTSGGELYRPKYIVTNWIAIVLAELGMTRADPRIRRTAELIIDRWSGRSGDLSGEICITGNAVRTLIRFGYLPHPKVQRSIAWIIKTQKRDGGWHCFRSRTGTLDGWEGLAALAEIPPEERSPAVRRSLERGAEFYLRHRLMEEGPVRYPPWYRIHFPNHYYYDLLVGLRLLSRLGHGRDPRLRPALRWLATKRRRDGTWALDAAHPDLDAARGGYEFRELAFPMLLEPLGVPSQWATVEALSILARVEASDPSREPP